jgi:hypothetical protein
LFGQAALDGVSFPPCAAHTGRARHFLSRRSRIFAVADEKCITGGSHKDGIQPGRGLA